MEPEQYTNGTDEERLSAAVRAEIRRLGGRKEIAAFLREFCREARKKGVDPWTIIHGLPREREEKSE